MLRERVPNGRCRKENDLQPTSDQISGTMTRFLLEDLRDRGGI